MMYMSVWRLFVYLNEIAEWKQNVKLFTVRFDILFVNVSLGLMPVFTGLHETFVIPLKQLTFNCINIHKG